MQKRILAIILALAMIFSLGAVNFLTMAQTTKPTISLESIETEKGENVSIKVSISNNPGLWGMDIRISYDKTAMTLTSVDNGDFFQAAEWTKGNLNADVYTLSYEASELENISNPAGILAILNFKIGNTTTAGAYDVKATYNAGDIINVEFDDLEFDVVNGKVTVKETSVAANGVTLNKESLSLNTGDSETLIATVSPENATDKNVVWESSNQEVATVDNTGKVTAAKKGTATITVKTVDGGFSDTCEVSVACSHTSTVTHPAVASTCTVQGNNEYVTCNDCGIIVSGSAEKLPLAAHKGGTATCKDKAVCTVCAQPYGAYATHTLINHAFVAADHNNMGNIEYWTCNVCNKYFSDANASKEIAQADTVIPKVSHDYSTIWSNSAEQHWHECACGDKGDIANHIFDNQCDVDCNVCGYTRTITHSWNTVWSNDETGHWIECKECGAKKDAENHKGGTATCTDKAVCDICKNAYGTLAEHTYTENVDVKYLKSAAVCTSPAVYYKSCAVCGAASTETFLNGEKDGENHTGKTEIRNAVGATCTTDGYTGDTYCIDCGQKTADGKTISAGHKTAKVDAVPATHEKDGNIEYYTCSNCDKLFEDAGATKEITLADTVLAKGEHSYGNFISDEDAHWKACDCGSVIEKAQHTYGKWTTVKEATETEKGSKEKACTVCGHKITEEIPVTKNDGPANLPQTGDNSMGLWIVGLLVIGGIFTSLLVSKKKKLTSER